MDQSPTLDQQLFFEYQSDNDLGTSIGWLPPTVDGLLDLLSQLSGTDRRRLTIVVPADAKVLDELFHFLEKRWRRCIT